MRALAITSLATLSSASAIDLAKSVGKQLFARSSASSTASTETQGQSVVYAPGFAGGSEQQYVNDECYDSANNPVIFKSSSGKSWIQSNQSATSWTGSNDGENLVTGADDNTNWFFDIYDAYYNGSIWLRVDPPSGARCEHVQTSTVPYSYLRIGQMSVPGGKYKRSDYDSNPFYFRLGRTTGSNYKCQITPRKLFASMESSNNGYDKNVAWTLSASKSDNSWNLSGNLTASTASENNYYNVLPFSSSNTTIEPDCPSHFQAATLLKNSGLTMHGTVNASNAQLSWVFTDPTTGWKITGSFNGTAWSGGAKLDMSSTSNTPATTGQAKRVGSSSSDDGESFVEKHEDGIISGAVVGGVVILALIAAAVFFFWRRRKAARKPYSEARQVDNDDAWAMDDHRDERELKDGNSTGLKPMPSSQNLLSDVDTSYNAHRAPSPDPSNLPAYSDTYTPLKH